MIFVMRAEEPLSKEEYLQKRLAGVFATSTEDAPLTVAPQPSGMLPHLVSVEDLATDDVLGKKAEIAEMLPLLDGETLQEEEICAALVTSENRADAEIVLRQKTNLADVCIGLPQV